MPTAMQPDSTILITAYAVNPYKGSEDGTGWNLIYQAARKHRVVAITRKNNRTDIERFFREQPDAVLWSKSLSLELPALNR